MNPLNKKDRQHLKAFLSIIHVAAYLQIYLNSILAPDPLIHPLNPGTSSVEAVFEWPSDHHLHGLEEEVIYIPICDTHFFALDLPGYIDRSWLLVVGYEPKHNILFWWTTEMVYAYKSTPPLEITYQ
jgi:hypothetical protein